MPRSRRSPRTTGRSAPPPRPAAGVAAVVAAALLAGTAGCDRAPAERPRAERTSPSPTPTPGWDRDPASLAAVGDSITRSFNACGVLTDCPDSSWATGTDARVNSLARRLLGPSALPSHAWNLAKSGSRMAELPRQMSRAAAHRPDLVTVLTGANDACRSSVAAMTPVAEYRASFEESLRRLRDGSPRSRVYVASVPDLRRLWATGWENPMGRQIWKLGLCPSMLGGAEDTGASAERRRTEVYERVVAYNEALREVCERDRLCRYDGGAVFDYRFTGDQLSPYDWFHPSLDGQARLAEIAYRRITAP
ncbi:SGNH/GDSL hydrolase family protein [Streptomyces sp. NPDC047097]|uniref:SGNH/GDSL hydrolase family protein n=1 Tax=Streptomyces sp. NPDC047097 TaxID=3155260 RepID=UPI0033EAF13A